MEWGGECHEARPLLFLAPAPLTARAYGRLPAQERESFCPALCCVLGGVSARALPLPPSLCSLCFYPSSAPLFRRLRTFTSVLILGVLRAHGSDKSAGRFFLSSADPAATPQTRPHLPLAHTPSPLFLVLRARAHTPTHPPRHPRHTHTHTHTRTNAPRHKHNERTKHTHTHTHKAVVQGGPNSSDGRRRGQGPLTAAALGFHRRAGPLLLCRRRHFGGEGGKRVPVRALLMMTRREGFGCADGLFQGRRPAPFRRTHTRRL